MLEIVAIVVIGLGAILIVSGIVMSWAEYHANKNLGGVSTFVEKLTELVKALAGQPRSVVSFVFGVLLIFIGGVMAGIGGLTA